ncbi:MAG: GNAT family N-acetyltransferase [Planctomycetaceae bacterium]|nr:GNAT family N-acetyltransferase [Planctomycetaceae bacterium]
MASDASDSIRLRPATREDIEGLFAIHRAALQSYVEATWGWDDTWQQTFFRDQFDSSARHVICWSDDAIGFLDVVIQPDAVFLQNLEIDPRYQSRGIGTHLIQQVIADAEQLHLPVRLQVLKVNTRARALYERLEFLLTGQTETHHQMERTFRG